MTCFLFFFIDTLCSHFANGKAHGNLCRQFCVTRALQPESCQTFHVGKEVVFSAFIEESQKVSRTQLLIPFRIRKSKVRRSLFVCLLSSAGLRVYPISDYGRPMIRIYPRAAERPTALRVGRQFPQGVASSPHPLFPFLSDSTR